MSTIKVIGVASTITICIYKSGFQGLKNKETEKQKPMEVEGTEPDQEEAHEAPDQESSHH
jgi:hypothetical protein